ncbi:hypothetical protein BpHYR1_024603 [Brachionus plicatilis]|uniref:Uncharacterized protein n=1 Tax=Brachionus plicatilis TaxID=10195 RepID=A0A3M7SQM8_BRAPC|nr:hypothetical protein BpHYR1_024603 [Brachionus plicatilis]
MLTWCIVKFCWGPLTSTTSVLLPYHGKFLPSESLIIGFRPIAIRITKLHVSTSLDPADFPNFVSVYRRKFDSGRCSRRKKLISSLVLNIKRFLIYTKKLLHPKIMEIIFFSLNAQVTLVKIVYSQCGLCTYGFLRDFYFINQAIRNNTRRKICCNILALSLNPSEATLNFFFVSCTYRNNKIISEIQICCSCLAALKQEGSQSFRDDAKKFIIQLNYQECNLGLNLAPRASINRSLPSVPEIS